MTNLYYRALREGKWIAVELERLTEDERTNLLIDRSPADILYILNVACRAMAAKEDELNAGQINLTVGRPS